MTNNHSAGMPAATAVYEVFFFQAEDGIRDYKVTGVQTCALPISEVRGIQVQIAVARQLDPVTRTQETGIRIDECRRKESVAEERLPTIEIGEDQFEEDRKSVV